MKDEQYQLEQHMRQEQERIDAEKYYAEQAAKEDSQSPCEFCEGSGEFSRDNSDGVAVEGKCSFCNGTGLEN